MDRFTLTIELNESIFALMVLYAIPCPPGTDVLSKNGSRRFLLFLMDAASDVETGALRGRSRKERILKKSWGEKRGRWSPTANGNSHG
jgi:hypothetical protein